MNTHENGWFRVCIDGGVQKVHYTKNPKITDAGHLEYTDNEDIRRLISRSHRWEVMECKNVPRRVKRDAEQSEVIVADDEGEVL